LRVEAIRTQRVGIETGADMDQYVEDERFTCTDPAVAAEIFQKHHVFLMTCFLNRAQGIGWSNTPIYQYLRRHYPVSVLVPISSLH
jgi:hypothetical protein